MTKIDAPNYTYGMVLESAEQFLKKYNPENSLPVPELKKTLGIDAFITANFDQITIDDYAFNKYKQRTRFSFAHEIGHLVLHSEWFKQCGLINKDDIRGFYDCVDEITYRNLEVQVNTFASLILVPTSELNKIVEQKLGYLPKNVDFEVLQPIFSDLSDYFDVSDQVILRRLIKEGILSRNAQKF